ncbi:MAG: translocation/assembly module TamB, partial [Duncaniella sp.]|nr:translocation/assembly module TamB [Duncaniella sp.]
PVEALLKVRGDMRQPELSFDLDFPTLTRDTYRKVRSIVSTEDMMNRQIIYLLALNRFYTPDYMSTTHGNELVSVASSTISSRLGSMLGQLSDNWSIAPTIRSDRGDFSDVEVDVALSSHLLNNRLLFNGNFGYRDKSLNNNSFIGDFDIRYLLNRAGTIQLKAYNRYNDQNYYLKSALTTQGVGIVFKRDFDNIFSFLRRRKKDESQSDSKDSDSIPPQKTTDSMSIEPASDGVIVRKKKE